MKSGFHSIHFAYFKDTDIMQLLRSKLIILIISFVSKKSFIPLVAKVQILPTLEKCVVFIQRACAILTLPLIKNN